MCSVVLMKGQTHQREKNCQKQKSGSSTEETLNSFELRYTFPKMFKQKKNKKSFLSKCVNKNTLKFIFLPTLYETWFCLGKQGANILVMVNVF